MFQDFVWWHFGAGIVTTITVLILFRWAKEKILPYKEKIWDLAAPGEKIKFRHPKFDWVTGTITGIEYSRRKYYWLISIRGNDTFKVDPDKTEWEKI